MSLRATQQIAELLQSGGGVLRSTQQIVEVLVNEFEQLVEQSIAFSDQAVFGQGTQTPSDDLGLTDTAVATVNHSATVEQTIAFADSGEFEGLTQETVSDTIDFQQTASVQGPIYVEVHHVLNFSENGFSSSQFVNDVIVFEDGVGRVLEETVSQSISFTDSGERTNKIVDVLNLSQAISAGKGGDFADDLGLEHAATRIAIFLRTLPDVIQFGQTATYTLLLGDTLCQYSPFVGTTTDPDAPTPPSLTLAGPNDGILAPFQLLFPHTGPVTDSVSIRAPNLGNRDRLTFDRINRETRGGTLLIFADPNWPKIQTLVLNFSGLKRTEALELLRFMNDHIGLKIGLIDWEQRYWEGVIVSPSDAIVADHHDSYSASFSFEGVLSDNNPEIVPGTTCAGTAKMVTVKAARSSCLCIAEEVGGGSEESMYTAETDSPVVVGTPVYLTGAGHIELARANAAGTAPVIGVANEAASTSAQAEYITEGKVTKTDWSAVAGTTTLTVGATYYLSPTTAGRITSTAPIAVGEYVVKVGRATSPLVLDLEIESPIKL